MTDMPRLEAAVLRLANGTQVPVTVHEFSHTLSGPSLTVERFQPASLTFAGGFKMEFDPAAAEALHEALKDAPVDPAVDEQFDDWTCPGCGKDWDEIPVGHSWALGFDLKTGKSAGYTCQDPTIDGEQALAEYMELGQRQVTEVFDG